MDYGICVGGILALVLILVVVLAYRLPRDED